MIRRWLEHPPVRGAGLDDPATTWKHRRIIREKDALRAIYEEWYRILAAALPEGPGRVLEIGSGGGFLSEVVHGAYRSDLAPTPWVDAAIDAHSLPFASGSLRGIVMTNVLHHLSQPSRFFDEAGRCVRPGGVVAMIEPWNTAWSRLVYKHFHHEPFLPDAEAWESVFGGPLSGGNGALPWILFVRDRERFTRHHPQWWVRGVEPLMPLRYLLSGGVSLRTLAPAAIIAAVGDVEKALRPLSQRLAMFAAVVLERRPHAFEAPGGY